VSYVDEAVDEAVGRLGLTRAPARRSAFEDAVLLADGVLEDRPVSLRYSMGGRAKLIVVGARLVPRLDLGLSIRRSSLAVNALHPIGDETLDSEFSVSADERARLVELLTPELRARVVALHGRAFDLHLHDGGCRVLRVLDGAVEGAWLVEALQAAVSVVQLLDEARGSFRLHSAEPLAHLEPALRAFAGAQGLSFSRSPLVVEGEIEGRRLRLASKRTGRRRHQLSARASFAADLGVGLAVRRQGIIDTLLTHMGRQDIQVGDAAFDARFLVQAGEAHEARVASLLDHDARAALVALSERVGEVTLDDKGISIEEIPPDREAETMVWALDALVEITGRVSKNLLHGAGEGPYR
jgi:hypothetical protein